MENEKSRSLDKNHSARFLDGLNPEQRRAVLTTQGPVLILAGAGSGKTRVLTHRIAYLIYEKKISAENILAVTFTNKAANEMRERVEKLLQNQIHLPYLGTFHSICAKILRREIHHLNIDNNFSIFDQDNQKRAIKNLLLEQGFDPKQYSPETISVLISSAKNELINPDEYLNYIENQLQEITAQIYPAYQKYLYENSVLDFDDLLCKIVELFEKKPEILQKYQRQFQYILIDEYQDTNKAQYKIVNLLAQKNHNLCVVGDDWQAIYSWRGADFRNILDFEKEYPEATIIKLEQNYRSTKNILEAAQKIIEKNQQRSEKKLYTRNPEGEKIHLYVAQNEKEEAEFVLNQILDQIQLNSHIHLNDFAIFYRTNAQSRVLEEIFLNYGITYQIIGGVRFYERAEVKDILAYLCLIQNPLEKISLERIINLPPRGIGKNSQKIILQNWQKIWSNNYADLELNDNQLSSLENFLRIMSRLQKFAKENSISEIIEEILKITGYKDYLLQKYPGKTEAGISEGETRLENIQELKSVAWNFSGENHEKDLINFLEEVALMSEIDDWKDKKNAVTLMTLHNAKGLEFPIVFIVGMEENLFPHSRSMLEPAEIEEERRLCYVGMTRAKQKLYCVYSQSRMLFGNIQTNLPSRFLSEIPEEYFKENNYTNLSISKLGQKVNSFDSNFGKFNPGEKVWHEEFGEGTIVSCNLDTLTIVFPGKGIKHLDPDIALIKRINN